jgi:hypothetical protein
LPINKQSVALKIGVSQNAVVEDWETHPALLQFFNSQTPEKFFFALKKSPYGGNQETFPKTSLL